MRMRGQHFQVQRSVEAESAGQRRGQAESHSGIVTLLNPVEHSMIYMHRDLSATNILLSEDKVAKLADFGMARPTDVVMTQLPGSAVYMPPEAAERKYGPPLDVFSYGVVTLFTLTRVFPQTLLKPTYDGSGGLVTRSELERSEKYMDILYND